jgi:protein tyrosine phosphatase (PTP) superfamily phosphohydrolase (DUF442 family)
MNFSFRRKFPEKVQGYLFLTTIWLFTGFALGAAILLWPLRYWVNYIRDNHFPGIAENTGVIVLIVLLVLVSFRLSLGLFHWHASRRKAVVTVFAIALPLCSSAGALYLFMNPDMINNSTVTEQIGQRFTIGPYPTEKKIRELKKQGYTCVVSLLHPAVVPFEPELLHQEEVLLGKYHIQLVKAPMLPWIADNEASLKIIRGLIKNGNGKYYIHCYLGKDRVNVVRNLIEESSAPVGSVAMQSSRTFEEQKQFERGAIYQIDTATFSSPYPTDEELFAFFLAGNVKTVVNIMDSTVAENTGWIVQEKAKLEKNGIIFRNFPVRENSTAEDVGRIVDSILSLPRPVVVHHWNTTCPESKWFRRIYYEKIRYPQVNLETHDTETY